MFKINAEFFLILQCGYWNCIAKITVYVIFIEIRKNYDREWKENKKNNYNNNDNNNQTKMQKIITFHQTCLIWPHRNRDRSALRSKETNWKLLRQFSWQNKTISIYLSLFLFSFAICTMYYMLICPYSLFHAMLL